MTLSREFKIGFVALLAVALALWGINYLKGINIFQSTSRYYAAYGNVKGLIESAVVYLNGYKVGQVTSIEFDEDDFNRIIVEISLDQKVKLLKNTTLVLRGASLISGTKDLDLVLGAGPEFHSSGDTLATAVAVEMTDLIGPVRAKVESLVTTLDTLATSLNDVLDDATKHDVQATLANLHQTTESLKMSMQPSGSLGQTLGNLALLSETLSNSREDISDMLKNLSAVSDTLQQSHLKALIAHANATLAETSRLFASINNGTGTAGQLVVNDSLYRNLNSALASLDSLLKDLREHPKRYVHLSVFGKKDN
jgi:phospholipid/cholesterol/gamma-HCH transport system substrate-binding protein